MNYPVVRHLHQLNLEPGDVVTAMTTYQDTVFICTRHGHLYTMKDGQPPMRQSFGPR
jgi:hypothetical protein